jgi:hypothetical protein
MKKYVVAITIFFCFSTMVSIGSNKDELPDNLPFKKIYGVKKEGNLRIPPPLDFLNKSVKEKNSHIHVNYKNFPDNAKAAFDYAVSIWESLINTDVAINIDAYWTKLEASDENEDPLGAASAANFYIGNDEFPRGDVFYVSTLAEKFAGKSLNNTNGADMIAYFNSEANWYYGTDGNTPTGQYDLVTVVVHEMCHAFGFQGSITVDGGLGIWGYGSRYPFAYDQFVVNGEDKLLIDNKNFANPSKDLYNQITSSNLFFDGPALRYHTQSKANLYAPTVFEQGSSVDHLGENYNETANDLMTSGILRGSSNHDPGLIARSIMEDMGWTRIKIVHDPVVSDEKMEKKSFKAQFIPDFDTEVLQPTLFYSDNGSPMKEVQMVKVDAENNYVADIDFSSNTRIQYYLSCSDKYGRKFFYPNTAPEKGFIFEIGEDFSLPKMSHYPMRKFLSNENSIVLFADVSDIFGIDSVWVEYYLNTRKLTNLPMRILKGDTYNLIIDLTELHPTVGDSIRYRIVAKDKTTKGNLSYHPAEGYHVLKVEEIPQYITSYENTFESGFNEFKLNGFELTTARGFSDPALHSKHPYLIGGGDVSVNTTAELNFPIKIAETDHYMAFDEIVLVEPSANGADFGSASFYDYVVVEASKDAGKNWLPLTDGWDSRSNNEWLKVYNQSLIFNNSAILYDLDLYKHRLIDLTASGDFVPGDLVTLRFRLYSDQFNGAWGWAIDNLKVQTVGVSSKEYFKDRISVYPNPSFGHIFIGNNANDMFDRVCLYDFTGKLVFARGTTKGHEEILLPSGLKGIYLLIVQQGKETFKNKLLIY